MTHPAYSFVPVLSNDFVELDYCSELSFAVCTAKADYIPIGQFRETFELMSEALLPLETKSFLFDKRQLRTFHQPSMEWYFISWKPAVARLGIRQHFKILPDLDWFVEAVNAGKQEILGKIAPDLLNGITVTYVRDIGEASQIITSTKIND